MSENSADYSVSLVPLEEQVAEPVTLFRSNDPVEIVQNATAVADQLKDVIKKNRLYKTIQGRDHVLVEGWTLCGSLLGVFPIVVWSREVRDDDGKVKYTTAGKVWGWEARIEVKLKTGQVIGAAEAMCTRAEHTWSGREDFALRSMSQTRATSKAMRLPLGFIMSLAGYESTPAEEMSATEAAQEPAPRKGKTVKMALEGELVPRGELNENPSPAGDGPQVKAQAAEPLEPVDTATISEAQKKLLAELKRYAKGGSNMVAFLVGQGVQLPVDGDQGYTALSVLQAVADLNEPAAEFLLDALLHQPDERLDPEEVF